MQNIKWTGDNQIEISRFLGHEAFWHKNGVLMVERDNDSRLTIQLGGLLLKDENGKVTQPMSEYKFAAEAEEDPEGIINALAIIEARIHKRLHFPSGDRTEALKAIALLRFWAMPLQNAAESLGFDDYLGGFIRDTFDTPACQSSWEIGFLKAHQVDGDKQDISQRHALKLIAQASGN